MKKYFILLVALAVECTPHNSNVKPPMPTPDDCLAAEINLQNLCDKDHKMNAYCCQVVAKTKKGKSFASFCADKASENINLNPVCLSKLASCNGIDACTNSN